MGKRQRRDVKARKAAAIEERRLARKQRAADRAAGVIPPGPGLGDPPEPLDAPVDEESETDEV